MKPIDLSNMQVIDLSQNWDINTPSFATYEGPTVKWIKRPAFEKVGGQFISSTLHVGTHLDAPLHFITNGQDIGSIPLSKLVGPGVVRPGSAGCRRLRYLHLAALRGVGTQNGSAYRTRRYCGGTYRLPQVLSKQLV